MIVVASSDNESSQVRSVHLGLTRFLTMVEVADVEDGVVFIDRVAIFYDKGEGGEHYIATRISSDVGFRGLKIAL